MDNCFPERFAILLRHSKMNYEEVAHKLDRTKDQTRTYTLKISYPEGEEYKKSEYQNIIDCIEVKIDARQIYR